MIKNVPRRGPGCLYATGGAPLSAFTPQRLAGAAGTHPPVAAARSCGAPDSPPPPPSEELISGLTSSALTTELRMFKFARGQRHKVVFNPG